MSLDAKLNKKENELLLRRASRLRQAAEQLQEEDGRWAAEFPLGKDHYAVDLENLIACVPLKDVTPIPLAASGVIGVLRWEGKLISVFSLASLLGVQGWKIDPSVLLILTQPGGVVAIDCETIPRSTLLPLSVQNSMDDRQARSTLHIDGRRPLEWLRVPLLLKQFLNKRNP